MGVRTAERITDVSMESLRIRYKYIGCGAQALRCEKCKPKHGGVCPTHPEDTPKASSPVHLRHFCALCLSCFHRLTALACRAGSIRLVFIGARAVQPRHRNIQQAEINA